MTIQAVVGGKVETALMNLADASATVLVDNDVSPLLIHSIAFASASGDTLTLDTYDGTNARRLKQVTIAANADGAYEVPFVLQRTHDLRGTLSTGNATVVRVTYTILES